MTVPQPGIYFGKVTHRRLRPVKHALSYDVASILIDVDDLAAGNLPALLGHNRINLFSIYDNDHGEGAGEKIRDFVWRLVRNTPGAGRVAHIFMLCYPRVLGFGFNPLTTYFAVDAKGQTVMMIYEVRNTFGGRHIYVTDAMDPATPNVHSAEKVFRVSPFNRVEGTYILRASDPGETVAIGVALSTAEGPLLNAYFSARRKPLSNPQLLRVFFGLPLMTLKVVGAIHWEALKLWRKGLNLQSP
jgi:uncharacterized protein